MNSNKFLLLTFSTILLLSISAHSKDSLGSLFMGLDYLPESQYKGTSGGDYALADAGWNLGFSIPINLPVLDYCYRVSASTHNIESRSWGQSSYRLGDEYLYDYHLAFLNEFLLGKQIEFNPSLTVLPQLGFGLQGDGLFQNDGSGYGGFIFSSVFFDLSNEFRVHLIPSELAFG